MSKVSKVSNTKEEDEVVLFTDDISNVVIRPPQLDWEKLSQLLTERHRLFLRIERKKAWYGKRKIEESLNKEIFCEPAIFERDNGDEYGYLFMLPESE